MTLGAIDWRTITQAQAARLIGAAARREQSIARKFESGQATESELFAAIELEENLRVFALTGERPA